MGEPWILQSSHWFVRIEPLRGGLKMWCWRRPDEYDYPYGVLPYGWIRVSTPYNANSGDSMPQEPYRETFCLDYGSGPLELECIAWQMREKYTKRW